MINVGDRYFTRGTAMNVKHGILPDKDAWITHIGGGGISILVFQVGQGLEFLVPRELFGVNFDPDRSAYPNGKVLYGRHTPATTPYR